MLHISLHLYFQMLRLHHLLSGPWQSLLHWSPSLQSSLYRFPSQEQEWSNKNASLTMSPFPPHFTAFSGLPMALGIKSKLLTQPYKDLHSLAHLMPSPTSSTDIS